MDGHPSDMEVESISRVVNPVDEEHEESERAEDAASISTSDTMEQKAPSSTQTKQNKINVNKMVQWTGYSKRSGIMLFRPDGIMKKTPEHRHLGDKYHMSYKMYKTECKLVRNTLNAHGFHEAHPNSNEYNLLWTGSHLRPYVLRSLTEFQKVNHFPRSYEITRKDRLYRNVQRMQQLKGFKHFDFVPLSFITPGEFQDFCTAYLREKGTWIVKPIASSRGRGIFLINHPDQLALDETYIVSRYVPKPLLVDGFKFDLRLYVAVTSYDPLIVYMYEEGLCRFATVRYELANKQGSSASHVSGKTIKNHCMHLTNYSVNKKSGDFVQNEDPEIEDYGNKWSLGALLRCLRIEGHDTTAIMMRIEDAVIKTLISVEMAVATATKMFMPFPGNCFELYGFDILLDSNLRPWVLEVNLSPSLACDAPIDLKIKSNVIADLFSLTGFVLHDPMLRTQAQSKRNSQITTKDPIRQQKLRPGSAQSIASLRRAGSASLRERPQSPGPVKLRPSSGRLRAATASAAGRSSGGDLAPLSQHEARIVRRAKEEHARRGGFVRIFPTPESWDLYNNFLSFPSGNNQMLHQRLFPDRYTNYNSVNRPGSTAPPSKLRLNIHMMPSHSFISNGCSEMERFLTSGLQRAMLYERKLGAKIKIPKHIAKQAAKQNAASNSSRTNQSDTTKQPHREEVSSQDSSVSSDEEEITPALPQGLETIHADTKTPQDHLSTSSRIAPGNNQPQSSPAPLSQSNHTNKPIAKVEPQPQRPLVVEADNGRSGSTSPPPGMHERAESSVKQAVRELSESFDLVQQLKKGCLLTRCQARFAFATYLTRVQYRLMSETGGGASDSANEDLELVNEQMDLVLRFLKRAAFNLSQPFKVVVPSRRLPVNDRRRILAKQLGDFVHIYTKETESLMKSNKKDLMNIPPSLRINQSQLEQFVTAAEETELEEVLTTYTKINKSAAIFLGSSRSDEHTESSTRRAGSSRRSHRNPSENLHGVTVNGAAERLPDGTGVWQDEYSARTNSPRVPSHSVYEYRQSESVYSRDPASSASAKSSFQNAAYVYSGKTTGAVNPPSMRSRPTSATSPNRAAGGPHNRHGRPSSASLNRKQSVGHDGDPGADKTAFDATMDDVNVALQRLNVRQQERNYSKSNITHHRMATAGSQRPERDHDRGDTSSEDPRKSVRKRHDRTQSAGETFTDFLSDNKMAAKYTEASSTEQQRFRANPEQSRQQQQDRQNLLMEQSKALLESSKAKHQAMVAQAHAATKKLIDVEPCSGQRLPHPPACQRKETNKPASAAPRHRAQHRYPAAALRRTMSNDDISIDFYNSLKYDTATGQAKVVASNTPGPVS